MRYGIISDIHSNLPALQSVIDELNKRKVDKIICLGDIVGYSANPNECCELVRRIIPNGFGNSNVTVMGNHDAGVVGLTPLSLFNSVAKEACIWTAQHISPENKHWLSCLPLSCNVGTDYNLSLLVTHSAPSDPKSWKYILSLEDAFEEFSLNDFESICFVGHSHIPVTFYVRDGRYNLTLNSSFVVEVGSRYIINPGSVGQPRDGDTRASFGIFDTGTSSAEVYPPQSPRMEIIRVEYDIESAQQSIITAGLPEFLSLRLAQGR